MAVSQRNNLALSGSKDKTLKLWDIATGREVRTFIGHKDEVTSVAFSPNGKWALSGSCEVGRSDCEKNSLKLWGRTTGMSSKLLQA